MLAKLKGNNSHLPKIPNTEVLFLQRCGFESKETEPYIKRSEGFHRTFSSVLAETFPTTKETRMSG